MRILKKPASNLGLNAKEAQKIMMVFDDYMNRREGQAHRDETLFTQVLGIDNDLVVEIETIDGEEYQIIDVWRLAAENAGKND